MIKRISSNNRNYTSPEMSSIIEILQNIEFDIRQWGKRFRNVKITGTDFSGRSTLEGFLNDGTDDFPVPTHTLKIEFKPSKEKDYQDMSVYISKEGDQKIISNFIEEIVKYDRLTESYLYDEDTVEDSILYIIKKGIKS